MTVVEYISWPELLKNTIVTAQHGNDGNRIATATKTLQQAAHQLVKVLNERARLFANSAQFSTALRDAAAIRAMLPGSGLGYLCMGDVRYQQGRYAAAIAMYDQGLQAAPESDPYYQQLHQQREKAMTNNNSKRVDFISKLPLDIVITNIVPRMEPVLTSAMSFAPLDVSRTWRERILKHPKGLHFGFDEFQFNRDKELIVQFAPYIQSLAGLMFELHLDDFFSGLHLPNLKNLAIYCRGATPRRPLMNGLQMVADSLTHLDIKGCPYIQLRDLVEPCPNLVSLIAADVELVMPSLPSSRFPNMSHLSLYEIEETDLTYNNMNDVLSRFPSLLSLEITPEPESRVLTLLHEHCPYLQDFFCCYRSDDIHNYNYDVRPNRKGITSAHLGGEYVQDDLIQFLHLHRHTLETIVFGCCNIDDNNCYWKLENGHVLQAHGHRRDMPTSLLPENDPTQTKTTFTRLVNVSFSDEDPTPSPCFMSWLLSNAPNLKTIDLNEPFFLPVVSNALINMRHLSKLEITMVAGTEEFYDPIISFMKHHIAMEDRSTLEEMILQIDSRSMYTIGWLGLVSQMKRLKHLKLVANVIPKYSLRLLENIGRDCPSLESLTVGTIQGSDVTDGVIRALCQHPKLKRLTIGTRSISAADLFALPTFPSLERLRLQKSTPDSTKDILRQYIPKAIIE
ncbi:hypothetical protein O0I10_011983 [Lichtheimia ornata]|uniref:F-box domain-containing protein n=1 Tax=Lichtheimia ornata TaxID=688661 RepID=A0AAD7XTH3_9FUNG|nr:uncharacterized protein O0I10_011983 [Lichtheimia ornata]KAJ8652403.1 hypothetical protein O0I10_011983 [Lichtheimia ornata]